MPAARRPPPPHREAPRPPERHEPPPRPEPRPAPRPPEPHRAPEPPRAAERPREPPRKPEPKPKPRAPQRAAHAPTRKPPVHAAREPKPHPDEPVAGVARATKWYRMLASWYSGGGGGSCGNLQDGHLHFAELGVAGDYGHGRAVGRGNMAIDLGRAGSLPCNAAGWVRYKGKTTYASKADVGYGDTSKAPNASDQRRIDLYENLAHYLGFTGVDYIEFAPNFATDTHPAAVQITSARYVNPMRDANVRAERIDQGVDYAGTGYIVAIAEGDVSSVEAPARGWPGNYIEYKITQRGPLNGVYIYAAEGVEPLVHYGEHVSAGQRIARLIPNWQTGIECGFAAGDGTTRTYYAYHDGPYNERTATRPGIAYDNLVKKLGGPGGHIEGEVVGNWPEYTPGGNVGSGVEPGGVVLGGVGSTDAVSEAQSSAATYTWGDDVVANWSTLDRLALIGTHHSNAGLQFAKGKRYVSM